MMTTSELAALDLE